MRTISVFCLFTIVSFAADFVGTTTCQVSGGTSDDGPAIKAALASCNNGGTVVLDKTYTLATVLHTSDLNDVAIQLSGTIKLNPDISYWKANGVPLIYQSAYAAWTIGGSDIHIYGGGTYNGSGDTWYAAKETGPIPWTIYNAKNVLVEDIHQVQSPFWHNFVYQSLNVTFNNITLHSIQTNGSQAQNTGNLLKTKANPTSDGWDIYRSSGVTITNSNITNGDDCVSLKPNSTSILIQNLTCRNSHGISIGSLGQYAGTLDTITNALIKNITMINASNGARIKAFGGNPSPTSTKGGGSGYVRNVTFEEFRCEGCRVPVVIDMCYETGKSLCREHPSLVEVEGVHFIDVTGTGKESVVVRLECSSICEDITAVGTKLVGKGGETEYVCRNVGSLGDLDFPCEVEGNGSSTKS